jgi:very-short-patch-repair endonuclease
MTDAEQRLWYHLRAHRFASYKFKRQVPIGSYIVDFACLRRKLVVEVDGGQHAENPKDQVRDHYLEGEGFRVLRFWNNDVLGNTNGVLEIIPSTLETPLPARYARPPSPRFAGRGERRIERRSTQNLP